VIKVWTNELESAKSSSSQQPQKMQLTKSSQQVFSTPHGHLGFLTGTGHGQGLQAFGAGLGGGQAHLEATGLGG
jgi:hypothetical protein